jgi:predicted kinase
MEHLPQKHLGSPEKESPIGNDVTDEMFQRLLQEIEQTTIQYPQKTDNPFILIPTGLIASGKSTIVKEIAKHYSLVIIRTDSIRSYLQKNGYNLIRTVEFAYHLVMKSLKQGYGIAIDADVVQEKDRNIMMNISKEFHLPLVSIKVITPEDVILSRLDESNLEREYRGQEAISRYHERKSLHKNDNYRFDVLFEGDKPLEPQLSKAYLEIDKRLNDSGTNQLS